MERKIVYESVFKEKYYDESFTIPEFLEIIQDAVLKGATNIGFSSDDDSSGCGLSLYFKRPETDKEYNDRIKYEEHMRKFWEDRERKQYEELKQKFG